MLILVELAGQLFIILIQEIKPGLLCGMLCLQVAVGGLPPGNPFQ